MQPLPALGLGGGRLPKADTCGAGAGEVGEIGITKLYQGSGGNGEGRGGEPGRWGGQGICMMWLCFR